MPKKNSKTNIQAANKSQTPSKKSTSPSDLVFQKLFLMAKRQLNRAHSPYSRIKVGAAVLMNNGRIYGGCNVENASYGGTICAERVAVTKAISEGAKKIKTMLIVTNQPDIWPPCGMCRQVIAEFSLVSTVIYSTNLKKEFVKNRFQALFPNGFDAKFLRQS